MEKKKGDQVSKQNKDTFYPNSYHKADLLQAYIDRRVNTIAETITVVGLELTDKDFAQFKLQLQEYINDI